MKHGFVFFCLLFITSIPALAVTHTVTSAGFTFSPASITITAGDTLQFVLSSMHYPREVSQATWNADGTTSNGGFDLPLGAGTVILTRSGTYYYVCVYHVAFGMKGTITVTSSTGVGTEHAQLPGEFALAQNFPNPFNPSTNLQYSLPVASNVRLSIYNILSQQVAELVNQRQEAGMHTVEWNPNGGYTSGIYFYRFDATSVTDPGKHFSQVRKLVLLK